MQVIENTHNLGFNLNFKTACMRATADLIAISDQDDVWMPEKIQKQVQAIGDYNLCFSAHLRGERMETAHIVSSQLCAGSFIVCRYRRPYHACTP